MCLGGKQKKLGLFIYKIMFFFHQNDITSHSAGTEIEEINEK
jgi:hypothetical protein